ncbi:MAG: aldo/keto reductase [Chloroflexi bacterium]|nr:aldo/keto reductase [Chloroflexota bacterium]
MEYRVLGKSDLRVSSIGLGCVTFGREIDAATSFAVMDRALERGITLFDTAEAYAGGRSEEIIGRWIADRSVRERIVLATKVRPPLSRDRILTSAEASLRRLQTDAVDLFLLHSWDASAPLEEPLEALDRLVRQGKARAIGCSNLAAWQLCKALWRQDIHGWPRMEAVQPNYNLVVRDIERELLPLCADQQIGVISYSPLGGGFLTGKYRPGGDVPAGTRMDVSPLMQPIYFHETGFRILEELRARAVELGTTIPLLALAWTMTQPGITAVLIGARSPEQVDQALDADALGMSAELRAEISAL